MSTPLIVSTPVLVDVRPVSPALSNGPFIRVTPRLVFPVRVGFVAFVAEELAIPIMPRALLVSLAEPNERE